MKNMRQSQSAMNYKSIDRYGDDDAWKMNK